MTASDAARGGFDGSRFLRRLLVAALLLGVALAFWKFRLFDFGRRTRMVPFTVDLFTEHYGVKEYGFDELLAGRIPLWNPHQLCGMPFLAIPHAGLFYPGNLPYLLFDTAWAIEIGFVLHLFFGGVCMHALAIALGMHPIGAFAAAVSFMVSGSLMQNVHQPVLLAGLTWLPATLLLTHRTMDGRRTAPFLLTLAIAFQLLNGATEVFVHTMLVAAMFTLFLMARRDVPNAWSVRIARSSLVLGCVGGGLALAAFQLLPSLELVSRSVRAGGSVSLVDAMYDLVEPASLVTGALGAPEHFASASVFSMGALAIAGIGLGAGAWHGRPVWVFGCVLAAFAVAMMSSETAYSWYFATPFGRLFRFPEKFLDIYSFALALLVAVAVTRLCEWRSTPRGELWSCAGWLSGLLIVIAGTWWQTRSPALNVHLWVVAALMLSFGAFESRTMRTLLVASLLVAHLAVVLQNRQLSFAHVRPAAIPGAFETSRPLLEQLAKSAGHERVYLSPALRTVPGLTQKQGMMRRIRVASDYETLALDRSSRFFGVVSGPELRETAFSGFYSLGAGSRLDLMDLTGTRFYVVARGEEADRTLGAASKSGAYTVTARGAKFTVYRRERPLSRAYFVSSARVLREPEQVLAALQSPSFEPRREVLIEGDGAAQPPGSQVPEGDATVLFLEDEAERVVIEVKTQTPGYLVLSDNWYPGWIASVDGTEAAILRANYLFRAVAVDRSSRVIFEYRPSAFRAGVAMSLAAAGIWSLAAYGVWRRQRRAVA